MTTLDALHDQRAKACAKLDSAAEALQPARNIADHAAQQVTDLEPRRAAAQAEQAGRLADAIARGAGASLPLHSVPDAAAPALNQARSHAALTTQAMATLEAAHVQRVAELQAAERAVIEAVDQILCDEDIAAAREVSYHLNEAA